MGYPDDEQTEPSLNPAYAGSESIGKLAAAPRPSELERFASAISKQNDLIQMLDAKLSMVSDRSNAQKAVDRDRVPHLSTLVDFVNDNNAELNRLINELVL